ncbi:hypothetical protein [Bacillus sp. Hm123]|uniref:hypothetical protein n=1 Tax=Bacillus sp. Hm123 TaxID=3450745 RepID=UPI003F43718D
MQVRKADFQYGALLSVLINSGNPPILVGESDKRNIYQIDTNRGSYYIYAKYRLKNVNNLDRINWNFSFTEAEIQEIRSLLEEGKDVRFAFVCSAMKGTTDRYEVVLADADQVGQCINIYGDFNGTKRLNVVYIKNHKYLQLYGSDRADKIEDISNTIRVDRDWMNRL